MAVALDSEVLMEGHFRKQTEESSKSFRRRALAVLPDEKGNSVSKCGLQPHRAFVSLDAAANFTPFCVHQSTSLCARYSQYSLLCSFSAAIHGF